MVKIKIQDFYQANFKSWAGLNWAHTACPGSYRVTHGISHATWQNPYLMAKTMQYELCHAMTFLMGYSKTHASHTLQWYEFCHAITGSSCSNDAPLLIMQSKCPKMHYKPFTNVYRLPCSNMSLMPFFLFGT